MWWLALTGPLHLKILVNCTEITYFFNLFFYIRPLYSTCWFIQTYVILYRSQLGHQIHSNKLLTNILLQLSWTTKVTNYCFSFTNLVSRFKIIDSDKSVIMLDNKNSFYKHLPINLFCQFLENYVFSRPRRSQGLLYKHLRHSLINWVIL